MLKDIQDLLIAAEAANPDFSLRLQVTTTDVRVSGFGKRDTNYNTAVKVDQATVDEVKRLIDIVVTRLASM